MTEAKLEHQKWLDLCTLLKTLGVVTPADLMRGARSNPDTQGLRVLKAVREWGDARASLAIERATK